MLHECHHLIEELDQGASAQESEQAVIGDTSQARSQTTAYD